MALPLLNKSGLDLKFYSQNDINFFIVLSEFFQCTAGPH